MSIELETNQVDGNVIAFPATGAMDFRSHKANSLLGPEPGPIERQMRADIASLKGTSYPDTFDWSVYDRIASRLEKTPRGGAVFGTTIKLVNSSPSCAKCHYALEIDTYGRGCFHDCAYCYAKDQLKVYGYWNRPQPFPVNLASIRKLFWTVFETDRASKWRSILLNKVPLRIGSMSDSFMWMDAKYGVTKELLRILKFYQYPYVIFTRSDLVAHDDYLELLDKRLAAVQLSIIGNNNALIRKIEPGAPSYKRRLNALAKLRSHGFWTTVRINPLFPKFPDGYYSDPDHIKRVFGDDEIPSLPLFDDQLIPEIAATGTRSILAGVVRLPRNATKAMSDTLQLDLRKFFREELRGKDNRFSDLEVAHYYRDLKAQCDANKIRFSTCYIGNGEKDYDQYQHLWTNKKDCCDVRGNVPAFKASCQDIDYATRVNVAANKGSISTKGSESSLS